MPGEETAQTFSFETMAVVLYAMQESGVTLGSKHYEMMAAISGKGKDSFNHQFRKVKARAKQLGEQAKNGTLPAPPTPAKKGNGGAKNGKPAPAETKDGKKRARKPKKETEAETEDGESPTKKVKAEPEEDDGDDDDGDTLTGGLEGQFEF